MKGLFYRRAFYLQFLLILLWGQSATAQLLWQRVASTPALQETGEFMAPAASGFVLVGKSSQPLPQGLYLSKVNYRGDTLWTKRLKFPGASPVYARGITTDHSGNLAVTASAFNSSSGLSWGILAKLTATGDTLWSRKIGDGLNSLVLGNDGSYVYTSMADTIPAIFKCDATGRLIWRCLVPYSGSQPGYLFNLVAVANGYLLQSMPDYASMPTKFIGVSEAGIYQQERLGAPYATNQLRLASDGNVLAVGGSLCKLTPVGDTIWSRVHRIGNSPLQGISHVVELPSGRLLATGSWFNGTTSNLTLFLLDRNGQLLRDTLLARFGSSERTAGVGATLTGDYVWAGSADTEYPYNSAPEYVQLWFCLRNWDRLLATQPTRNQPVVRLYPNPADDFSTIATADGSMLTGRWQLCDLLGRTLLTGVLPRQPTCRLPLQTLAPGLYLVRINATQTLRLEKR